MQLVSSAQNQEDIMLWRALRHVEHGFYIDVGAADPIEFSVTRLFYKHGWRGINLEPNTSYFEALCRARPHDINLCRAVGPVSGWQKFLEIDGTGLSTFDAQIASRHREGGWNVVERPVQTLALAEICETHRPEGLIHFLKIDVEGSEAAVLESADFQRFRPWIVLVEATMPLSQIASHDAWEARLVGQGYHFVWFDGLNRFYVADEMAADLDRHFHVPPNHFDGFESAATLLRRTEQAERGLCEARAAQVEAASAVLATTESLRRAAEAVQQNAASLAQQFALTAEWQRRAAELDDDIIATRADLEDTRARLATMREDRDRLAETLADKQASMGATEQLLQTGLAELAGARQRAERAEARVGWMLASTSWRLTAPTRMGRRLLSAHWWRKTRQAKSTGRRRVTQTIRAVLRRTAYLLLKIPGLRPAAHALHAIAPAPVEWLARHLRADERSGALVRIALSDATAPPAAGVEMPSIAADLSECEARIFNMLVVRRA